jgi:chromate reductase
MRVLAIQAGLGGDHGNGAVLLEEAIRLLAPHADVERLTLSAANESSAHDAALSRADAIVIATGTYWDSWSSHLQRFLETATPTEGTALWLGKPAAVLVTAHAVGGKGVLSRLQGVLVTLGAQVPPMSGLVVTMATELARAQGGDHADDLWSRDDLDVVCHNLLEAARGGRAFRSWAVDRGDPARVWLRPR